MRRPALQSYDPVTRLHTAQRLNEGMLIGAIALREQGGFLLATNSGLYEFEPESGKPPLLLANPEADKPENRFNDGKCDRRGRFWVGTMMDGKREPAGTLYCFADRSCRAMLTDFIVPNSIAFSPDDTVMYFADSHAQIIWSFDFDLDDGVISNRRVFKDWTAQVGRPDGSTVDEEAPSPYTDDGR